MPSGRKPAVKKGPAELTASQLAELRTYETNWELALESLCRITDRKGKGAVIPFKMRKEQRKLFETIQLQRAFNIYKSVRRAYEEDWEAILRRALNVSDVTSAVKTCDLILAQRPEAVLKWLLDHEYSEATDSPVLVIVVKARQIGVSTLAELLLFLLAFFNPGAEILVLSTDDASAQNVMKMTTKLVDKWPADKEHFKPHMEANARDRIELHNGALFFTRTIKGGTIRSFFYAGHHLTEFAHYPDQEAISDALIAKPDHSWVIIESTAKGKSGGFFDRYQRASTIQALIQAYDDHKPMPDQAYVKWFSSWLDDPEYQTHVYDWEREALQASLDEYERSLFIRFPAQMTLERVKWRREKIENECQGKLHLRPEQYFMQEYPADEEEAFQQGSKTVFNHQAIQRQKLRAKERKPLAFFNIKNAKSIPKLVSFEHQANLAIWEMPKPEALYAIGGDISGGLLQDFTVLPIYDRLDGTRERMVGIFWTNRLNEIETAHIAVMLARLYNDAFIVPEANNYGHSFMNTVWQTLRYHLMYTRESTDAKSPLTTQERWGYDTKRGTKQELIAKLQEALNDNLIEILDLATLIELELYELTDPDKSTTKMGAPAGKHDDRVIATALARFGSRPLHGAPSMQRHAATLAARSAASSPALTLAASERTGHSKLDITLIEQVAAFEKAWDLKLRKAKTVDKKNPFKAYN